MPSFLEKVVWLLKKAGKSVQDDVAYYYDNPSDVPGDVWDWIKDNKITCSFILGGILVIAVPPLIGFGAAGPVAGSIAAGWQASIGNVAAGSLFAILQSLGMTGVFTSIGAWMMALGGGWKMLRCIGEDFHTMFGGLSGPRGIGFTEANLDKRSGMLLDGSDDDEEEG